jgi:hypothetical protein
LGAAPTRIEIVADETEIPWLGSGKPDKLALRSRLRPAVEAGATPDPYQSQPS